MKNMIVAAAALTAFAVPATAGVTTLTFEGVGNLSPVGNYYAPNYIFSEETLALVDEDAGGNGNFANEPSPNTVMFFLDSNNAILDVTNGFTTGFSFYYSSSEVATVTVWDGFGGTGNLLGQINLAAQHNDNCRGDPTGTFCNWTAAGVDFLGMAYSIDFGGGADHTAYDNITFGASTPGGGTVTPGVPEPATWGMMILGFGLIGSAMRRRSTRVPA